MKPNTRPHYDLLIVILNASTGQGTSFPIPEQATGFEIRQGALCVLDGVTIVRAYASGQWESAIMENREEYIKKAQALQQAQAEKVAAGLTEQAKAKESVRAAATEPEVISMDSAQKV